MLRIRGTVVLVTLLLAAMLVCCGKKEKGDNAQAGATSDQVAGEKADAEVEKDSEQEEAYEDAPVAAADLFFEDGDVCTPFFRLTPPEEWDSGVTYHYFQEPEAGRYTLDIIENISMAATDGVGGFLYSIALYETYPEERGMENSAYAGMLKSQENGYFYVFLEFPIGTQYTQGSEETYNRAADTKDWIAGNIEGRNGYTFEAGKEPENES